MIQFTSVTLLYLIGSNLSDFQFLYIDLFQIIPLSIFMGWTGPYHKLTKHLPQSSLISFPVLLSVLGSVAIQFSFQIFLFYFVTNQDWYLPLIVNEDGNEDYNYLNY